MKNKLLMICAVIAMVYPSSLIAQYTYSAIKVVDGGNPGSINTDSDSGTSGWTSLIPGGTSSTWSSPIAIPFSFDFYGSPVSHVMINGNGVVTFDTTATAIPSNTNTNLPATGTSNIPDSSILGFWDSFAGDGSISTSDVVYYKVFGTAPNRQLWFKYYSYEYGDNGSGGSQCSFAYWGIAIEETTNKIYVSDFNYHSGGAGITSTIGVQLNSTTAVQYGTASEPFGAGSTGTPDNDYYEFTPVALVNDNAAITSIDAPVAPLSTGLQNVDVTLFNAGLNSITSATVNWKVNGVLQTAYSYSGTLAQNASTSINLGTYNFMAGTSTIEVWSSSPNATADADTSDDSLAVTLCTSLSGVYTIGGTSPDYSDIASAVSDLNSCGINGPVTFNIAAGTYTGSVIIGDVVGSSAANSITFNGGSAATTTMTYDASGTEYGTFTLNGTDYVTIKNMTIENTGSSSAYGVHLTNTADYNTIDSCIVSVDATSTSSSLVSILVSGSLTSTGTTGNNGNNNTVSNTTTNGGYYGIRFYGNSSSTPDNSNNKVENCDIIDAYYYGIYFYYQDSPEISGNNIPSLRNTSSGYGIYVNYAKQPSVTKNSVHGALTYGLFFGQVNTSAQNSFSRALIANNMITSLGNGEGIYLSTADSVDVWNNSVYSENENALWINSSSDEYDVRNNIFVSLNGPEVIELDAVPSATDVLDYNLYYHSAAGVIADITGTDEADLATWQASYPALNVNSVTGDPVFLGATDLHLGGTAANNVGISIALITDDIDGELRSATTPDIGADEYAPPSCPQPSALLATNLSLTSADLGWTIGGTETEWAIEWGPTGFTPGLGNLITSTTTNPYALTGLTADTDYEFYVRSICAVGDSSGWSGPGSFFTGYCTPAPSSVDNDGITNVTIGTINNSTLDEAGHYGDYSAMATRVVAGSTQNFSIEFSTGYTYDTKIWVDWNNDLVFDDVTEVVYSGTSASPNPSTLTGSFTVPVATAIGSYKMRIGGADSGPVDPCYTGSYGSFEDYTLFVPCEYSAADVQVSCGPFTWTDGITYTVDNNTAVDTLFATSPTECDTIFTLDVTVITPPTGTDVQVACDDFTWVDGVTYLADNNTATYTYSTAAGCDSVVTLDLTMNFSDYSSDVHVACNTFTWIDGVTYTASTSGATHILTNSIGCDSIITLYLTINNSTTSASTVNSCGDYTSSNGMVYTASGTYTEILPNAAGCDSTITLNLTVVPMDVTVTQTGLTLMANQTGVTYQWLNCSTGYSQVAGESTQSYTVSVNGDYAVAITNGNCIDTSECISINNVGLAASEVSFASIYPNPTTDVITVSLTGLTNAQFELMDIQGKIIISTTTIANGEKVDLSSLESGIYFVRLTADGNRMVKRVVKQ